MSALLGLILLRSNSKKAFSRCASILDEGNELDQIYYQTHNHEGSLDGTLPGATALHFHLKGCRHVLDDVAKKPALPLVLGLFAKPGNSS
jgi:hypothetical protein